MHIREPVCYILYTIQLLINYYKVVYLFVLTGVPVILCGAQLVEKQILKDYGFIERGHEELIIILQFISFGLLLMTIFGLLGFYFLW